MNRNKEKARSPLSLQRIFIRFVILVYILCVIGCTYWYWMRPVRVDQFAEAQETWRGYAEVFNVASPDDERYGW